MILANAFRSERTAPWRIDDFRMFPREEPQDDSEANDAKTKGMIMMMNQLTAVHNQAFKEGRLKK